ncbi:Gfo/Idh/MocA family oxidoreductase [Nocardia sp. CDC186]|uniref:Gfo/Idh/MocA family oxidoreductase n=1 Tax=Nocardia implantans TaxID=3108168 RepID=A0ABU6AT92_9NOCA|nr:MULTISPECIES: Gfo/Idh/MocA family oxidoreductase [unclassified Nocardia]MBF6191035.1 Gfo/Idh/MocA family oxidoreductase [Nocardia beijingensis]MEA3529030.1 Gfo/Idh/MocA family oxidoreductase [Nocardia sp. CDC192]MEB3510695.1 Gfo/Idh/MocA family oxidoreductase [Nocardia sp. CDC186]
MSSHRAVTLGLAGTGRIGTSHAETLKKLPNVATVLVADADADRARTTAAVLGVEFAPDLDTLFAADLDGLIITTTTDSHPGLILRAVDAGIPVFCEKPVAADITGTLAVVDHLRNSPVPVQIGFQRRFDAGYRAAREAIRSGRLGWLHTLRATTLDPAPPPAEYIARSGGLFRDCGVHDFDIIRWVTGREIVEVYALGANRGEAFFAEADDVDTGAVLLRLDDGALATVSLTRYNGAGYDVRLEALGSKGNAIVGLDDRAPLTSVEPDRSPSPYPPYSGFMERFRPAYAEELAAFIEVATGRLENPCTPAEALEAFYVAEACELSRREGRAVEIAKVRC